MDEGRQDDERDEGRHISSSERKAEKPGSARAKQ